MGAIGTMAPAPLSFKTRGGRGGGLGGVAYKDRARPPPRAKVPRLSFSGPCRNHPRSSGFCPAHVVPSGDQGQSTFTTEPPKEQDSSGGSEDTHSRQCPCLQLIPFRPEGLGQSGSQHKAARGDTCWSLSAGRSGNMACKGPSCEEAEAIAMPFAAAVVYQRLQMGFYME